MNELELRKSLLTNASLMCEYVENKLHNCNMQFDYKFNVGFIYGYKCDYIHILYDKDNTCKLCISHHDNAKYVYICKGKVFEQSNGECTKAFLSNFNWYLMVEMESAIKATMKEWSDIKLAIEKHLNELNEIQFFTV